MDVTNVANLTMTVLKYCFRAKLCHVEHIFVTHGSWGNVGGLMGKFVFLCYVLKI